MRDDRSELAIFITPKVVYSDEDAARLLREERGRLRGLPADTLVAPRGAAPPRSR
jgi:type II secretory pathway component GspD/PulD (secretin)